MKSSSSPSVRRPRAGFTLIELLTVIAIIGILAAIIIPTVSGVREKARQADCMSRLKSWGIAINTLAADNRGNYYISQPNGGVPWTQIGPGSQNPYFAYFKVNRSFDVDERVNYLYCPSEQNNVQAGPNTPDRTCFTLVRPWIGTPTNLAPLDKVPLSRAQEPARTMLMFERYFPESGAGTPGAVTTSNDGGAMNTAYRSAYKRHGGKINVLFMDGHGARMLWSGSNAAGVDFTTTSGALNPLWYRLTR